MSTAGLETRGHPAALAHCLGCLDLDRDGGVPGDPAALVTDWLERLERAFKPRGLALYLTDPSGTARRVAGRGVLPPDADWGETALRAVREGAVQVERLGCEVTLAPVLAGGRLLGAIILGAAEPPPPLGLVSAMAESLGLALAALRATAREAEERSRAEATAERLIRTERLAALGRLVSGIAHEINNPLCGIGNELQLVLLEGDRLDPQVVRSLENAWSLVERIDKLVRSFLGFARKDPPRRLDVRLEDVVDEVLNLISGHREYRNVEITVHGVQGLPPVSGDPVQLGQVVLNLLSNARDALDGRGHVRVTGHRSTHHVEVEVEDDGPGMPANVVERVFDPLFTTKEIGKGTGLGLSVCHEVIRRHGGEIDLETEEGRGTVVRFRLPIAGARREAQA